MSKIICIGSTSQDIFFPTQEGVLLETPDDILSQKKLAFELGAKYHIEERFESLGGCSTNVARGLSKLGLEVCVYTAIGDDAIGKWILQELEKGEIETSLVTILNKCKSDLSMILVDRSTSDRIIFSNQVSNKKLHVEESKLGEPEWFFIGDLNGDWQSNIDCICENAEKKGIYIAYNPRQKTIHDDVKKVREVIAKSELVFVNKDEAMEIASGGGEIITSAQLEDEQFLLKTLHEIGAKIVAITDGLNGAWVSDGKQKFYAQALKKDAIDNTGAGDAFTSGFFGAHILGRNIDDALKYGIANSSNSVLFYGGQQGLLNANDISDISENVITKVLG